MPAIRLIARKTAICIATILALLASASAQTNSITIGKLVYRGSVKDFTFYNSDGTTTVVHGVSDFELFLNTTGITAAPIAFKQAILIVKGGKSTTLGPNFPTQITTGNGCGAGDNFPPCNLSWGGGPSPFQVPACVRYDADENTITENCVSIALQLRSLTGKNFSFALANAETFCAFAVNNTYVLAGHKATLVPKCDALGFCSDNESAPVVLRAAPATSCTE